MNQLWRKVIIFSLSNITIILLILTDKNYTWADRDAVVYTNWAPLQPSDSNGVHHCVQVLVDGEQLWDDTNCNAVQGAVCIIDPGKYILFMYSV